MTHATPTHTPSPSTAATAVFTWKDIAATNGTLRATCALTTMDRRADWFTPELEYLAQGADVGGLMAWNATADAEGGDLFMFTGQSREQELQVLGNASWMVSAGAIYSAKRVGRDGYKAEPDEEVTVGGDRFLVWLLPNDGKVSVGQ